MKKFSTLLFVALVSLCPSAFAAGPFSRHASLWLANGNAGSLDTSESPTAVSKDGTVVVFGSSNMLPDGSGADGVSIFQKINGSWTETAFLEAKDHAAAVAISDDGSVVAVADDDVIDIFREPVGGWVDAQPSIKLAMPGHVAGYFSSVSLNTTELLGTFQPSCNSTSGCAEIAVFVEPGAGWASTSSPKAVFQDSIFGSVGLSFSDSWLALSSDTIAALDQSQIGTVTQLAPDWSGGQSVNVNSLPAGISSVCGTSGDAFAANILAIFGRNSCGRLRVALLQQTSSSWTSPALLATLTPSGTVGSGAPAKISASDNTIGIASFNPSADPCLVLFVFQQPVGGWVDASETVKYSGSDLGFTDDCATTRGLPGGFSVSDSVIALQTGSAVEVLDDSAIQPTVDIRATMSLAEGTIGAPADEPFQVTFTVANDDVSTTAPSVSLTSAIPSQLSHTMVTTTGGRCSISGGNLDCSFGDFPPGRHETIVLAATAPRAGDLLNEAATITSNVNVHSLRDTRMALTYSTYAAPVAHDLTVTGDDNGSPTGTFVKGRLSGSDPNGRHITYSLVDEDAGMSVTVSESGGFSLRIDAGVSISTFKFTYVTNNGYVDSRPATVTVNLKANGDQGCNVDCGPNVSPVANSGSIGVVADLILIGLLGLRRLIRRK